MASTRSGSSFDPKVDAGPVEKDDGRAQRAGTAGEFFAFISAAGHLAALQAAGPASGRNFGEVATRIAAALRAKATEQRSRFAWRFREHHRAVPRVEIWTAPGAARGSSAVGYIDAVCSVGIRRPATCSPKAEPKAWEMIMAASKAGERRRTFPSAHDRGGQAAWWWPIGKYLVRRCDLASPVGLTAWALGCALRQTYCRQMRWRPRLLRCWKAHTQIAQLLSAELYAESRDPRRF